MAALVDTNVLVYRFDAREPAKQAIARDLLRAGIAARSIVVAHQAIIEFYAAVIRSVKGQPPLLDRAEATREVEEMLLQFDILQPSSEIVRAALRGAAAYELSWFDALMWAHAETHGIDELLSVDFQHGRVYGSVRVRNPFV